MTERLDLNVAPGIVKSLRTGWVEGLSFDGESAFEDACCYCNVAFLPNGVEIGVFNESDDSAVGETVIAQANVHLWHLTNYTAEVPEGTYFGFKVNDDLSGLDAHNVQINWKD